MWCLIDEDDSTINDSMFAVDMGDQNEIPDLPSTRHHAIYESTFADGHAESIKWLANSSDWNDENNPDWEKLKSMTTIKK